MRHRTRTTLGSALLAAAMIGGGAAPSRAADPTWGETLRMPEIEASIQSLATTRSGADRYLHVVTSTAKGQAGEPPPGVWYRRTTTDGARWAKSKRLAPAAHDVDSASVAAAGHHLYVAWVRVVGHARTLYVRVNRKHGNLAAWSDVLRLTPADAHTDRPSVAGIAGGTAFVAYTNADSGDIRLRTTRDHGRTWSASTVGTTRVDNRNGLSGSPIVVTTGQTVGVFWVSDVVNTIRGVISTDGGRHWSATGVLGVGVAPSASARAGRIAVAAEGDARVDGWFRTWRDGVWSGPTAIGASPLVPDDASYGQPTVTQGPSGQLGLLLVIRPRVSANSVNTGSFLAWRSSDDGGATWTPDELVAATLDHLRDGAAVSWSDTPVHVLWTTLSDDEGGGRAMLRTRR